jgi:hypothetical protein
LRLCGLRQTEWQYEGFSTFAIFGITTALSGKLEFTTKASWEFVKFGYYKIFDLERVIRSSLLNFSFLQLGIIVARIVCDRPATLEAVI